MSYRIIVAPAGRRQRGGLRGATHVALVGVLRALAAEPRPRGSSKLVGGSNLWRVRVRVEGRPWRVIYRVDDRRSEIIVLRLVRRDEGTYRRI